MFKFYEVGGKVRDELLGLKSKDYDYVVVPDLEKMTKGTSMENIFDLLIEYLKLEGYMIFLTTPRMFTIRARFPTGHKNSGITADFVIARKEIGYKEGTREPIIVPGTLYDDLQRRDFTVNAIAKDIETGQYIDYFGGAADLDLGFLRTPIDANITFADDPLRLLRAIRFEVTKDLVIDIDIQNILWGFDYESKFHVVSEERIREELYKCFKYNTLETMKILSNFPELRDYIFQNTKLWLKPTNEL
jgi:poly(A) polymerase